MAEGRIHYSHRIERNKKQLAAFESLCYVITPNERTIVPLYAGAVELPFPFCDPDLLLMISHLLVPVMPLVYTSKALANSLASYRAMVIRAKEVVRSINYDTFLASISPLPKVLEAYLNEIEWNQKAQELVNCTAHSYSNRLNCWSFFEPYLERHFPHLLFNHNQESLQFYFLRFLCYKLYYAVDDNILSMVLSSSSVNERVSLNPKMYIFNFNTAASLRFPLSSLLCKAPCGRIVEYILTLGDMNHYFHAFIEDTTDNFFGTSNYSWVYAYTPNGKTDVVSVQVDPRLIRNLESEMLEASALGKHALTPLQFYVSICARITQHCTGPDTVFSHNANGRPYFPFRFLATKKLAETEQDST